MPDLSLAEIERLLAEAARMPFEAKTEEEAVETVRAAMRATYKAAPSLIARVRTLEAALRTIEQWKLPPTGKTWPVSGEPISYGAEHGSNGERDYMRAVARAALEGSTDG